jgi:NADH-quinone oxidoreductase subunit L
VFDQALDSFARLLAATPRFLAAWLRPIQNGLVQFYALAMALGVGVFLLFVVFIMRR